MSIKSIVGALLVTLSLSACVTTTDSRFTKKASPQKAVDNYVALGLGYLSAGNDEMARKKIDRALEIDPESTSAHNAMALYWIDRGENHIAEQEFLVALDLDDDYSPANYHFGRFLYSQKRTIQACEHIEKAALDVHYSGRVVAFELLGACFYSLGKTDNAMDAFEKAWQLDANSTVSSINLASIYLNKGRADVADRWFNRFESTLMSHGVKHNARSLWIGIQLSRSTRNKNAEATYAFKLRKRFPQSAEYKRYLSSK